MKLEAQRTEATLNPPAPSTVKKTEYDWRVVEGVIAWVDAKGANDRLAYATDPQRNHPEYGTDAFESPLSNAARRADRIFWTKDAVPPLKADRVCPFLNDARISNETLDALVKRNNAEIDWQVVNSPALTAEVSETLAKRYARPPKLDEGDRCRLICKAIIDNPLSSDDARGIAASEFATQYTRYGGYPVAMKARASERMWSALDQAAGSPEGEKMQDAYDTWVV